MNLMTIIRRKWMTRKPSSNWPYKSNAPQNREWKKDRKELFNRHGNGWYRFAGTRSYQEYLKELKIKK